MLVSNKAWLLVRGFLLHIYMYIYTNMYVHADEGLSNHAAEFFQKLDELFVECQERRDHNVSELQVRAADEFNVSCAVGLVKEAQLIEASKKLSRTCSLHQLAIWSALDSRM